jgi:NAD(P)-dependent dehydrogenase (short-subunit alcohol dehydrogenase family)
MNAPKPCGAVLITGCSTGIGRATAERLARAGHPVYATARRPEALAGLEDAGCTLLRLDVTDEDSMQAAVARVVADHGAVGALVNNAGYSASGAIETVSPQDLRRQFETNVFGLTRMCQLVLLGMREQREGRIVNISSMGANFTFPGGGVYHATKYAVEALSDALRFEVRGFGVKVVIVQPGLIRTEFGATAAAEVDPADGPYAEFNAAVAQLTTDAYPRPGEVAVRVCSVDIWVNEPKSDSPATVVRGCIAVNATACVHMRPNVTSETQSLRRARSEMLTLRRARLTAGGAARAGRRAGAWCSALDRDAQAAPRRTCATSRARRAGARA